MLNESIFLDEIVEFLGSYKVVLLSMSFAWSRDSSGVLRSDQSAQAREEKVQTRYAEAKLVREFGEQTLK